MYKVFSDFFKFILFYLCILHSCGNVATIIPCFLVLTHINIAINGVLKRAIKLTFSCKVGEVDWSIIHNRHGMHIKNSSYMWVCPVILKMLLTRVKIVYSQFILTKSLCDLLNFECYILKSWQIPYVWITGTIVAVVPVLNTFLSYLLCVFLLFCWV